MVSQQPLPSSSLKSKASASDIAFISKTIASTITIPTHDAEFLASRP